MLNTPESFFPEGMPMSAAVCRNHSCSTMVLSMLLAQQSIADVEAWLSEQQSHLGLAAEAPVAIICCGIVQWAKRLAPIAGNDVDKQRSLRRLLRTLQIALMQQVVAPEDSELQGEIRALHTIRRLSEHFNFGPEWDEVQLLFEDYLSSSMRPDWLQELTVAMRTMYYEATEESAGNVQTLLQELLDSLFSPVVLDFDTMAATLTRTNFALPHILSRGYQHEDDRFTPEDEAFIWNEVISSFISTAE